jgi:hypothetical protein
MAATLSMLPEMMIRFESISFWEMLCGASVSSLVSLAGERTSGKVGQNWNTRKILVSKRILTGDSSVPILQCQ